MKKKKTYFPNWRAALYLTAGICIITVAVASVWYMANRPSDESYVYADTSYGAFLAQQHAIYANDFESAAKFSEQLSDTDINLVKTAGILSDFLAGKLNDAAGSLKKETKVPLQIIYATHLAKGGNWNDVYARYKDNDSALLSAIRVWSSVAVGKDADAIKFINSLKYTHESWRDFTIGMIYAETGRKNQAKERFEKVPIDFMNLNDYAYMMAFYRNAGFDDAARALREDFTGRPAGLYMLNHDIDDFPDYSGVGGALAFSLIQAVSHSVPVLRSDLGIMLLRMAEQINNSGAADADDGLNYYLGMYFYENDGNYQKYFDRIGKKSLFYPFVLLKNAENTGNFNDKRRELERAVKKNPLFVPAIVKLVAINVQKGKKGDALRVLANALKQPNLGEGGRVFLLKSRARVHLMFGDVSNAQKDVDAAMAILPNDAGILSEQANIWITENKNLDDAYAYSIALVKKVPTEIEVWDTLGRAVRKKEGAAAALDIYEKVGHVAETCSSLFEHLGDIYLELGDKESARAAYSKALKLSDDGMTIESVLIKKLKAIK